MDREKIKGQMVWLFRKLTESGYEWKPEELKQHAEAMEEADKAEKERYVPFPYTPHVAWPYGIPDWYIPVNPDVEGLKVAGAKAPALQETG
jgi:hypothetical protein